ncbi:glycine cleavage system aminomethyltransferase GcvT [Alloiococcus sp. CFN-8]|uniref:glycine cleavage system aminomethyltransferase GcvT n=1 Tax=Alloiococcus sp. CFN-8 TaxID=3416081 RepID=UPI003CF29A78
MVDNLKKTSLFGHYESYGGKIIDFAGWALPVQFAGIMEEHKAVREAAGLFDVSHMGEITIKGRDALKFINVLITNDATKLVDNQVLYTMMCYENGGVVDDLLVYRYSEDSYLLVVNASNIEKDYQWILSQIGSFDVSVDNISSEVSQLALQGPKAEKALQKLTDTTLSEIGFFYFKDKVTIAGKETLVSRTGYTGEDGFEIYCRNEDLVYLWDAILTTGKEEGVQPIGLGARDTLRFEANLPLYGNELSQEITPLEAGFGFFVKLNKEEFIGKNALEKQKAEGLKRKIVAFEMVGKGIARHGYKVFKGEEEIGFVTTGYLSPTLGKNIGLALIRTEYAEMEGIIEIQIRNKKAEAKIISRKFYSRSK